MIEPFLDEVIDDINTALNATFPTFSELEDKAENAIFTINTEYNYFPDKYIRSVVCKGAASKYYIMDEEGEPIAEQFAREYSIALFYMVRDYIEQVPEEFRSTSTGSVVFDEALTSTPTPFSFNMWEV